jgi:2'-5' RNA ligase
VRLFAALPIPDHVAAQIVAIQHGIGGARWSPRDNLHITLRFMGEVDGHLETDIEAALGEISAAPFDLSLAGAGFFGHDKPHAAWLGVAPNVGLLALQKWVECACRQAGLTPEDRVYTPHVTLCYLPRDQALEPIMAFQRSHKLLVSQTWLADRFYLYASSTSGSGPSRYMTRSEYPLVEPATI